MAKNLGEVDSQKNNFKKLSKSLKSPAKRGFHPNKPPSKKIVFTYELQDIYGYEDIEDGMSLHLGMASKPNCDS